MHLKNKKAIVTGATRGIGKAIAIAFVKHGVDVAVFATNQDRLNQMQKELEDIKVDPNQKIIIKKVDVSKYPEVEKACLDVITEFSHVDILVNNSGGPTPGNVLAAAEEDFLFAFKSHLLAGQRLVRAFVPQMKANNWGRIIKYLSMTRMHRKQNENPLLIKLMLKENPRFEFGEVKQLPSIKEPLIQLADLFAGLARFSHEEAVDRKSTRLNSSHIPLSRMPSSA